MKVFEQPFEEDCAEGSPDAWGDMVFISHADWDQKTDAFVSFDKTGQHTVFEFLPGMGWSDCMLHY